MLKNCTHRKPAILILCPDQLISEEVCISAVRSVTGTVLKLRIQETNCFNILVPCSPYFRRGMYTNWEICHWYCVKELCIQKTSSFNILVPCSTYFRRGLYISSKVCHWYCVKELHIQETSCFNILVPCSAHFRRGLYFSSEVCHWYCDNHAYRKPAVSIFLCPAQLISEEVCISAVRSVTGTVIIMHTGNQLSQYSCALLNLFQKRSVYQQ